MSILTIPGKRWTDQVEPGEDVTYDALNLTGLPRAIIEASSVTLGALNQTELGPLTQTASLGLYGSITKSGDQNIPARSMVLFTEVTEIAAVTGATVDMVVAFPEADTKIVHRGHVILDPDGFGNLIPHVHVQVFNLASTDRLITDGTVTKFVCLGGTKVDQPTSPNAELTIVAGKTFTENEPILADGLNSMATPVPSVADDAIKGVELNGVDLINMANRYAGKRGTVTVSGNTPVSAGATVTLGTCTITGAVAGDAVGVNQPGRSAPLFTGYVSGADTVTVQARNNVLGSVTVPDGTVLTAILMQAP